MNKRQDVNEWRKALKERLVTLAKEFTAPRGSELKEHQRLHAELSQSLTGFLDNPDAHYSVKVPISARTANRLSFIAEWRGVTIQQAIAGAYSTEDAVFTDIHCRGLGLSVFSPTRKIFTHWSFLEHRKISVIDKEWPSIHLKVYDHQTDRRLREHSLVLNPDNYDQLLEMSERRGVPMSDMLHQAISHEYSLIEALRRGCPVIAVQETVMQTDVFRVVLHPEDHELGWRGGRDRNGEIRRDLEAEPCVLVEEPVLQHRGIGMSRPIDIETLLTGSLQPLKIARANDELRDVPQEQLIKLGDEIFTMELPEHVPLEIAD